MDIDKNGTIEYTEFLTYMMNFDKKESLVHLKTAFKKMDRTGKGFINIQDIQHCLKKLDIKKDILHEKFNEIDKDKNGKIDFNEFCEYMSFWSNHKNKI